MTDHDALSVRLRECWVLAANLRVSRADAPWPEPCLRAVAIESVAVAEPMRRQGVFKRFLRAVCQTPGVGLVIVEGVADPVLAAALVRWGWDFDPGVMDFYWRPGTEPCP